MNLILKASLSAKAFHMKIRFVCLCMKTNFHNKNFALSLGFIIRFASTRKWLWGPYGTEKPDTNRSQAAAI